jgi:excinuclease ABC subunit B
MAEAVREINRRRQIQLKYNRRHRIKPQAIVKEIRDWSFGQKEETLKTEFMATQDRKLLEQEMKEAAANLDFERAALIRDQLRNLRNNKTT